MQIEITSGTVAAGAKRQAGDRLTVPDDIKDGEARQLVRMGRAREVTEDGKPRRARKARGLSMAEAGALTGKQNYAAD